MLAFRVMLHIGVLSDYRKPFWRAARHALRRGQIDAVLGMGFIAHHLIQFTRERCAARQNASYYSTKMRTGRTPCPNWRPRCASRRNPKLPYPAGATLPLRREASHLQLRLERASTTARDRRRP